MDSQEKASLRERFQLKIHKANGQAFEDLFREIMDYAEPDFRSIKAWGNIGDRKNDGYIWKKGIFYQVFAPEDINKSYVNVVKKLNNDFNGLLKQWSPVNEFYFVVNDKYMGVNADCEQAIQAIEQEHGLKKAGFKTAADLEYLLFSLDEDKIYNIVGLPFDPLRIKLDYTVLSEIIEYLMKLSLPETQDGPIIYPDWDQKVTFNKLGELEARYLSNGFLQVGSLDEYLKNQSNTFADKVKDKLREIYMECSEEYSGSVLFWEMVEKISGREDQSFQTTAIILLSKYFESCDVFEEPDDTTNKTY